MRRLLITGGAGFIGSNFTRLWVTEHPEDRVVVLDALTYAGNLENLEPIFQHANYSFVKGDIRDFSLVCRLLIEEDIDVVVHFAAESHVDRSIFGPQAFVETNIKGTFALLEAARKCWNKNLEGKRFIQISTGEVHGTLGPDDPAFTEESLYRPNSPYSASKAAGDHLARAYHQSYGLPAIITNCSNNYGPYQFPEKLIPFTIINALERKPVPIYGNGQNIRDWIYVEDHCRALEEVLERGVVGEVYNIGGNCQKRNMDVIRTICNLMDERLKLKGTKSTHNSITFVADRPEHNYRYFVNTSKLRWRLGWAPQESFETGIRKTIDWYMQNQDWWQRARSGEYQSYYERQYGKRLSKDGS